MHKKAATAVRGHIVDGNAIKCRRHPDKKSTRHVKSTLSLEIMDFSRSKLELFPRSSLLARSFL